jgi:hypothetical protein
MNNEIAITVKMLLKLLNAEHTIFVKKEVQNDYHTNYSHNVRYENSPMCGDEENISKDEECVPLSRLSKWEKAHGAEQLKIKTNIFGNPTKIIPEEWLNSEVVVQFPTKQGELVWLAKASLD